MTTLDIIVVGVAIVLFVIGIFKGLLKRIFSIIGIVVVLTFGSALAPVFQRWGWLASLMEDPGTLSIVCLVGSYVILSLVCLFVSKLVIRLITRSKSVGFYNRLLGGVLSLAELYIVLAVVMVLVMGVQGSIDPLFGSLNVKYGESIGKSWIYRNMFDGDKNFFGNWLMNKMIYKLNSLVHI